MNAKRINAVIAKKFNVFANTIEDERVRAAVKANTIITGGAIASLLMGDTPKDYDLYFRNRHTANLVADYYVAKFKEKHSGMDIRVVVDAERVKIVVQSAGVANEQGFELTDEASDFTQKIDNEETIDDPCVLHRPVYLTSNAITLSGGIQLVIRFFGDPSQIHENYDFVHCTNYWTSWDNSVTLNTKALEALMNKELVYIGSKYPLASMFRIRKFLNRGYKINAGQMLKIGLQISAIDFSSPGVLEDQLIGVDTAYFNIIISAVNKAKEDGRLTTIDETRSYIFELVDRLF